MHKDSCISASQLFRGSLSATEESVQELEGRTKEAAQRINNLHNTTDSLRTEYIKITSNTKSAAASANSATDIAKNVEKKHDQLKVRPFLHTVWCSKLIFLSMTF